MLALFIAWLMLATVLTWITGLPGWANALIAAIPCGIWLYKRPEDF